ncbi:molybdopterin-dependent oxidoreductase [Nonomuraea sp. NN258]|uniref:molybdopterin-dependent oxidoreductase n=1 Tax=Nonomuraea antri TaxID=2730852 RepID=UPI00156963BA|nr:molybdopterin-dependent oxidoreductase [Nonomuraea antri]NRQ31726.1 molybdopterin-dependent oxidoreductase [Nonomuraea antri]
MRATFNGRPHDLAAGDDESAADVIREQMGLCGTKVSCGAGVCGSCTILLDGDPVVSCLLPAARLDGAAVTTVEGLGGEHPVQRAFMEADALQCGFCTPGFVVESAAFHDRWRKERGDVAPSRAEVAEALAGHLCRCGAYENIYRALQRACTGEFDDRQARPARVEALAKVTGEARYTVDVRLDGMLHGVLIRSDRPHARVGQVAGAVDLLGPDRTVRYTGQPIAAVAAGTEAAARRAAAEITVVYEDLPAALTESDPAIVYPGKDERRRAPSNGEGPALMARWTGNRRTGPASSWRGRTALRRLADAARAHDPGYYAATFTTAAQSHTALEPHATVADWRPDGTLVLYTSTQAIGHVRDQAAKRWGLRPEQVTVIAEHVGGGFGAKQLLGMDAIAAAELSRATGRPVRVELSRAEELTDTGYRPGTRVDLRLLADGRGELAALSIDARGYGGVSVGSTVALFGLLMYGRAPRHLRDHDVVSNAPPGAAFRGPGGAPFAWAVEQGVDEIAHRLGADPIELRRRWDGNARRRALYTEASRLDLWRDRPPTGSQRGRYRRGVGVAAANWVYLADTDTRVELSVRDGRLLARTATQDIGTGVRTVIAAAVRDVMDAEVEVSLGHSDAPHGPAAGGSRSTASVAPAARAAARRLGARLAARLGGLASKAGVVLDSGTRPWPEVFAAADGESVVGERPRDRRGYAVPLTVEHMRVGRGLAGAVHVTEVEVDTLLGATRVLRVWGGIAAGRIWSPDAARNQCEGGIVQGIGYALYEERVTDPVTGVVVTQNLEDYRIPGIKDTPEITLHFHEDGWDHVPGGGVGLGEVCTIGVAASVGNAVRDAIGRRLLDLPIRPDRLLEVMSR